MSHISDYNLERDQRVQGSAWFHTYGNYFSDVENMDMFVDAVRPYIPDGDIDILYVASAAGLLGERLVEKLGRGELTLVDISMDHLAENKHQNTIKICQDVLEMDLGKKFDVIIMRSSLDYFPTREMQVQVLQIIQKHVKQNGVFFNQPAYIPNLQERECISRVYTETPQIGNRWFQSTDLADIYHEAGFAKCEQIGEGKQLRITHEDHIARYGIEADDITRLREIIGDGGDHSRLIDGGYELRFDFPVFYTK